MRHLLLCALALTTATVNATAVAPTAQAPSQVPAAAANSAASAVNATNPAPTAAAPNPNVGTSTPPPAVATTGEVLQVAKLALDDSHKHSEHSVDLMKIYGTSVIGVFGAILSIFAFFGLREFKSVTKPVREKLERLTEEIDKARDSFDKEISTLKQAHKEEIAKLTTSHAEWQTSAQQSFEDIANSHMAAINEDLQAEKSAQQEAMRKLTEEFVAQSDLNSRAQVIASYIWAYVGGDDYKTDELKETVRLVMSVVDLDAPTKLDAFLEGVLLTRMAFAQKRLGNVAGAFASAKRAVSLNHNDTKPDWLYNTACYAALSNELEDCQRYLRLALEKDPRIKAIVANDSDFDSIREEEWFKALL